MLAAMRESISFNIPVFGLNRGNIGFLMNEFEELNLIQRLREAYEIIVHPLEMVAVDSKNNKYIELAINEVSIFRRTHQSAIISIKIDETERLNNTADTKILNSLGWHAKKNLYGYIELDKNVQ